MAKKRNTVMENITLERVPDSQRKPWYSIAFIWAGGVICIPALMVGSYVSVGLNFKQSVIAMVIGYCIVVAYMTLLGCTSSDLGVPTTVSISRAYGVRGSSFMVSLIIAVSMIGWFGYQTGLCANSFNNIMGTSFGVSIPMWLSCLIWGIAMFITAVYGLKLIQILNYVSVPALFIMLIWGIFTVIRNGSVSVIPNYQPATNLGMAYGITLAVV